MASEKRLNSVCHSIAHHAVSGLSSVHPHIAKACRIHDVDSITADLLADEPCPPPFDSLEPLRLSLGALSEKFASILIAEGFDRQDLASATVTFWPDPAINDDYCTICRATLVSNTGRRFEHTIDISGQTRAV